MGVDSVRRYAWTLDPTLSRGDEHEAIEALCYALLFGHDVRVAIERRSGLPEFVVYTDSRGRNLWPQT